MIGIQRKRTVTLIMSIAAFLMFAGCTTPLPQLAWEDAPQAGDYRHFVTTADGQLRSFMIHFPKGYRPTRVYPLVVMLHGAFSNDEKAIQRTGFNRLADKEGIIVMYPNGIGLFGLLQHWNAGFCCGKAAFVGTDDVNFVINAVKTIKNSARIDPGRIFLAGYSNGGMLAHRIASEHPDMFTALAVVAGSVGAVHPNVRPKRRLRQPGKPIPVIIVHGDRDESVPYRGGRGRETTGPYKFDSAAESARFWFSNNGCADNPVEKSFRNGLIKLRTWCEDKEDGIRNSYKRKTVALYTLAKWGHDWPGGFIARKFHSEKPVYDFPITDLIWSFFLRSSRPGS